MSNTPPNDPWWPSSQGEQPPPPPPPPPGGGYPPPPPGSYPPQQPGGYPPQQPGGYPPQQPVGYPPPGGGYQQPAAGYQQPGYPPSGGGYPPPPPIDPRYQYGQQTTGYVLAGWWHRVGATVVDFLVLLIPNIVISVAAGRAGIYAGGAVLEFIYISLLLASRGQTVGNMAVGTRVVDARTGGPITAGKAVGRAAAQLLFSVLGILVIPIFLDILWPLWDRENQTLHDKMAGTVVLKTN